MATIFGWNREATHSADSILEQQFLERIKAQDTSDLISHQFFSGVLGCSSVQSNSPLLSRDGSWALVVFGEIVLANGKNLSTANFDDGFLQPFLNDPPTFLTSLFGNFIFGLMSEDECYLVNDPSGNFAVYYAKVDNGFAFSTRMLPLRGLLSNGRFDEEAGFEQLGLSQSLDGRSLISGIQKLPRGTLLHFKSAQLRNAEYLSRFDNPESDRPSLELVHRTLKRAALQSVQGPSVTVALSGGFDSRMTWSILIGSHRSDPTASTQGLPLSRDIIIAQRITRHFQIKHDIVLYDEAALAEFPKLWQQFILLTEGQVPLTQLHALYAAESMGRRFKVLVDSYGGPLYRRQIKKFAERRINPQHNLATQVFPYEQTALYKSGLLNSEASREIKRTCLNSLSEYYSNIEDVPTVGEKFDRFYADVTSATRDSFVANLQMNYLLVRQPLMDYRCLQLAQRVNIKTREKEGIHKYVIAKSFPPLATYSLDYSGYFAPYRLFSTLRLIAPAIDRILTKLSLPSFRRPPMDSGSILIPAWPMAKDMLIGLPAPLRNWIDRPALEQALRLTDSGNNKYATALLQLLTFRMFLDLL